MKVLVVGSGGREHTLVWKLKKSSLVNKVFCANGNGGIAKEANIVDISQENIKDLADFAKKENIDLTIVGPEAPLTLGIVDEFEKRGLKILGPTKKAAEIEGSKAFSKKLMEKYNIPTGYYKVFDNSKEAEDYVKKVGAPIVVKADGLAAGKGVIVAKTLEEALEGIKNIMDNKVFGSAGEKVVIEEYLDGPEVSMLAFTDGETILPMISAQDHKRAFDEDKGPNTGGMGAFAPSPLYSEEISNLVNKEVLEKAVKAMKAEGRPYKGILYAGLILTEKGPKVLEYNCRFGDPETQVVLPLLENDLVEIIEAIIDNRLNEIKLKWKNKNAICVVMASGGYPLKYHKGYEITGIEKAEEKGSVVFHSGTKLSNDKILTSGGRVLGITALGNSLKDAAATAYNSIKEIDFNEAHFRTDIGQKKQ